MAESLMKKKIYYHDTDAGGVVYYANYLKHLEEGRTEFCAERGLDTGRLFEEGVAFVVVRVEVDYKAPARYGDTLTVRTRIDRMGNSSLDFIQEAEREGKLLIRARTVWACVNRDFRPQRIPEEIKTKLGGVQKDE